MKARFLMVLPLASIILSFAGCDSNQSSNLTGLEQQQTPASTTETLQFSEMTPAELAAVDANVRELIDKGIAEGWSGLDIFKIGDQQPIIRYNKMLPSGEVVHSPDLLTGDPDPLPDNVREYSGILTPEQVEEVKKDRVAFLHKLIKELSEANE